MFYEGASNDEYRDGGEALALRDPERRSRSIFKVDPKREYPLHYRYQMLVDAYTKRVFTFESGIIHAFSGILNIHYGNDHYYELPFCAFDYALLRNAKTGTYTAKFLHMKKYFPHGPGPQSKAKLSSPDGTILLKLR
jgi:hypothetical protein